MLVLSRKEGESVEMAEIGVVVKVIGLKRSKVQLGIEAPPQITVNRGEVSDGRKKCADRDGVGEEGLIDQRLLEHLAHVERELAALAELAEPKDRPFARQIASDSIQRLAGIRRTLRYAARQRREAQPIANFVRVRADVLDCLREEREDEPDSGYQTEFQASRDKQTRCVRQTSSGYAIVSAGAPTSCVA